MSPDRTARATSAKPTPQAPSPQPARLALLRVTRPRLRVATTLLTLLAVLVLFGLVGFQALIVRHQGRVDSLGTSVSEAAAVNQRLRLEVARLEAPDRVRTIATSVFGMVEPEENVSYLEPIPADQLLLPGGARASE